MHSLANSLRKRLYSVLASPCKAQKQWGRPYWQECAGFRDISCLSCPKFDERREECSVPFGTPIRKCVVASIEAHLHDAKGISALELGFGRFSLGKKLIERSGGIWTGVEPHQPKEKRPQIGQGCYGHTASIPFADQTFDLVFGIQTFEHWGQKCAGAAREASSYKKCLDEVLRVLKPGGSIYFDAPIHLHGHEMFIMGDIPRILSYFPVQSWCNLKQERWRYHYHPLERFVPCASHFVEWREEISSYSKEEVEKITTEPIWLFSISAEKCAA